jgi:O-antigen/teichoic acid export membrane protein
MAQARGRAGFSAGDLLARMALGVVVVLGLWNPTGYSYVNWLIGHAPEVRPYVALTGVTLLILAVIYLRATFRSIGLLGIALASAFVGALLWVFASLGLLDLGKAGVAQWAALVSTGLVLGIGLSWSHVRRALTGQADVDDVSE